MGLAGSLHGLRKATTLDFLHILGMLLVFIFIEHAKKPRVRSWSEVFDLLTEDVVKSGCFVAFHLFDSTTEIIHAEVKGLVKSQGPRGEHVSAAFGSLTLLEWWSGFPRLCAAATSVQQ